MKKIWGKEYGGSFGLGRKSLSTDTDTETWSQFRLPIPKPGFGRTLVAGAIWHRKKHIKRPLKTQTKTWKDHNLD